MQGCGAMMGLRLPLTRGVRCLRLMGARRGTGRAHCPGVSPRGALSRPLVAQHASSSTGPPAVTASSGGQVVGVAPSRVKAKEKKELREASTKKNDIRVSPWQLNLLAKAVRGLPVPEAIATMKFSKKKHSETFLKTINNACNLADIRHGLKPERLRVSEVYVTRGRIVNMVKIMGKGRSGVRRRKWSHVNLTVRELDFDEEAEAAPNKHQRRRWERLKAKAEKLEDERRGGGSSLGGDKDTIEVTSEAR